MNPNDGLPQNAPWVPPQALVTSQQVLQNGGGFASRRGQAIRSGSHPPQQNPSALQWAGIAAGTAALAGAGGYYLWQRHQQAQTGVEVNADCTKLIVSDTALADAYMNALLERAMTEAGLVGMADGFPVPLDLGALYVELIAPHCGVKPTTEGIQGVDTWQKAAMVGGAALVFAGNMHDQGWSDDAFRQSTEQISQWLIEHGIDDLTMIEDVYEMPSAPTPGQGGEGMQVRAPNMGMLGWGLAGIGAAAAGGAGYLYWRNKKLNEACLSARTWFGPDGSITPEAEAVLDAALDVAIAEGATDAIAAADRAITTLSENQECRLPKLIWGDLLKVRAIATAKAAAMSAGEPRPGVGRP